MRVNHYQGLKPQAGHAGSHGRARAGVSASHGMSADRILALQSQVGNQATMAMAQTNPASLPHKDQIEAHFGHHSDGVKVHNTSDEAAQIHAMSYAQGTDIHVGSGQEQHLPHEASHVIQQESE